MNSVSPAVSLDEWIGSFAQYEMIGARVHALAIDDLNVTIEIAVRQKGKVLIPHYNQHALYLYHRYSKMRDFYRNADLIHIDGMSLVFWGKLLGYPVNREHRVTYVDWLPALMRYSSQRNWRIYYLGSKPGVAEQGASTLRTLYSGLQIATHSGYFDAQSGSDESEQILLEIESYEPHILMVGMGMPRQEYWILDHLDRIRANAILTCGAALDYVAGRIPTPPRWLGQIGLEWVHRLFTEPRRLGLRYLIEPWFLAKPMFGDLWVRQNRNNRA